MNNHFKNTAKLTQFILRRERVMSAVWIAMMALFSITLAPMLAGMFDAPARKALVLTVNNPAMIAMLGPIYGMKNYTPGAMYFNMMIQWVMIAAAIMNILLVVRHTRADEERGRADMVLALPTGRLANLTAIVLTALIVNGLMALLTGLGIAMFQIESMDLNGSLLYSTAISASGLVFAALAAIFSQISRTSRGAIGLSVAALGFFYLLRGAGDIGNETLALFSPLGLAQRTKAYVANDWLPILVLLTEAAVLTCAAFALNHRRDIRQGFLPEKRGREEAGKTLRSPYGLAFRLLMTPFFGWIAGMFIIGASYGSILGTIDTFVSSSAFYSMIIGLRPGYSTAQMFASMVTLEMALCAAVPVLTMIFKLRSEEKDGTFINLLARPISRRTYLRSYVLIALAIGVLTQLAAALGIYCSAMAVLPNVSELPLGYLLRANLVYVPALWFMLGLAVLLIGLLPRVTTAVWGYFGFSFFLSFAGRIPGLLPVWVPKLSPFGHIPNLPVDKIHWPTLAVMIALSFAMMILGEIAYQKRDLVSGT